VKALREVNGLPEADALQLMNEESLTIRDGVVLIQIMQRKAAQLNELFQTSEWTPRKIDMILWTYGRESDPPKVDAPASRKRKSSPRREEQAPPRNQDPKSPLSNHIMIASALEHYRGQTLTTSEIKTIVLRVFQIFLQGACFRMTTRSETKAHAVALAREGVSSTKLNQVDT